MTKDVQPSELEDLQVAVDEALWRYDPVRGALWELRAEVKVDASVEVTGHVRSRSIREGVIETVQAVPGVQQVVDRIVTDPLLETEVARALAGIQQLPPGQIAVHSHLGRITLLGKLPSESLRQQVLSAANDVMGVRSVADRLTVES